MSGWASEKALISFFIFCMGVRVGRVEKESGRVSVDQTCDVDMVFLLVRDDVNTKDTKTRRTTKILGKKSGPLHTGGSAHFLRKNAPLTKR